MSWQVMQYGEPVGDPQEKQQDAERLAQRESLGIYLGDMFEPSDGVTIEWVDD